ncbi:DUF3850 domain-containing protein [Enterococcus sp. AZ103]|uniref:DUF3850 domain-containing protein n=1 Tax=Enterococcus sp. AZ103 TaxID=2774628 RepID=UPI003F22BF90
MEKKGYVVTEHNLKILPEYFREVESGNKMFEIRKNDRDFKVNDTVHLKEFDGQKFTGDSLSFWITYITDYMQQDGYVVFGLTRTIGIG